MDVMLIADNELGEMLSKKERCQNVKRNYGEYMDE